MDPSKPRLSVFDMLKVGVGPSSSHTLGPWRAAERFLREMPEGERSQIEHFTVNLYGSLAKTGRGHATDLAVQLGLTGADPETIPTREIRGRIKAIAEAKSIALLGDHTVMFDPKVDIVFHREEELPFHPNGLSFVAKLKGGETREGVFYSVGGGFVVKEGEQETREAHELPFPIDSAAELLEHCESQSSPIWNIVWQNELTWRTESQIVERLSWIRQTMVDCIYRGCHTSGELPGGLHVQRRAAETARRLLGEHQPQDQASWIEAIRHEAHDFRRILDWVSCFALAVNEENAALGRVVTAPTNGAAGVIPAVMFYAQCFCEFSDEMAERFLLVAGEIGCLFKKGATVSAAQGGCQAEIGVSSAMAAAALAEGLGGTPAQAIVAAEIAMEHHLGMTCDPIGGLVQIPCIERNAMGAVKAITAAQMALQRNPADVRVSLDAVIRTMWQTALDMNKKYKETSEGGLAVQIPVNVTEC